MSEHRGLRPEQGVERIDIDLIRLELGPGVGFRVRRVDAANEVPRESVRRFEPIEGFKRARGQDSADIPQDRFDAWAHGYLPVGGRTS